MDKCLILLGLIVGSYAYSPRIVNGTDAEDGEFPFAVSLRRNDSHTCGATILNENFVLTAAHCVCNNNEPLDASIYSVQYGSVNITTERIRVIDVAKINCNNFSMEELIWDSAVLELEDPLPFDGSWEIVKLSKEFNTSFQQEGVIIGWGRLWQDGPIPDTLQKLTVDVYDDELCGAEHDLMHHICFGADDGGACNGDSGTALIVDGIQVGIASFISAQCGIANQTYPNVYSRVATYYDWIYDIAGGNEMPY